MNVAAPEDGLSVALDGVAVGRAEWGIAVPVNPGEHTVEATAAHFKPWSEKLSISKEAHDDDGVRPRARSRAGGRARRAGNALAAFVAGRSGAGHER